MQEKGKIGKKYFVAQFSPSELSASFVFVDGLFNV